MLALPVELPPPEAKPEVGVTCGVSLQLDEGCGEGSLRSVLMEPGATAGLQPPQDTLKVTPIRGSRSPTLG